MRKLLLLLVFACLASTLYADCNNFAADGKQYYCSMTWNSLTRYYWQQIPTSFVAGNGLVIGLHGSQGSGATFSGNSLTTKAASNGFIFLRPDATNPPGKTGIWQTGGPDGDAWLWTDKRATPPDDIGFIRALIARFTSNTAVSPNKIFAAGFSVGAGFANDVAIELSDVVAAVFVDEGIFPVVNPSTFPPQGPVSIISFHGQFGAFRYCGLNKGLHATFPSQDQEFNYWTGPLANNCSTTTTANFCTGFMGTLTNQPARHGSSCSNGTAVDYYQIFCGQHAWYDSDLTTTPCTINPYPGLASNPEFGAPNSGVTTDDVIWNFFAAHPKASGGSPTISLSPTTLSYSATAGGSNPANQTFTVTNTGSGTLSWTGTKAQPWLTISPTSRGTGQTVTASINISGLAAGTYTDTITIAAAGATNTPQTVAVTLTLKSARAGSRTRSQSDQSHPPSRLPRK